MLRGHANMDSAWGTDPQPLRASALSWGQGVEMGWLTWFVFVGFLGIAIGPHAVMRNNRARESFVLCLVALMGTSCKSETSSITTRRGEQH